ncbi:MAG: hypothetical protein CTY12_01230 [Methylotenera sp.]|nr:MAG: hypothetical protein CTY12_01230 [Methylotenera sp.]
MFVQIERQKLEISENDLINAVSWFIRQKRFLSEAFIRDGRKIQLRLISSGNYEEIDVGPATEDEVKAFEVLTYLEDMKYFI